MKELDLHFAVADYLALVFPVTAPERVLWTHLPMGEYRTPRTAAKLKRMGVQPGWPDFAIMAPEGNTLWVEMKVPGGRLSPPQVEWHAAAVLMGHNNHIAYSVEDVEDILRLAGLGQHMRGRL